MSTPVLRYYLLGRGLAGGDQEQVREVIERSLATGRGHGLGWAVASFRYP